MTSRGCGVRVVGSGTGGLQTRANRRGVAVEAFCFSKNDGGWTESVDARGGVLLHGDDFEEVCDAQPSADRSERTGGQGVIGAGNVVSQRLRGMWADEDRAGVADPGEVGVGVDGEMFGGEAVGDVVGFV